MSPSPQAGFTMIEMMISLAVITPLLIAVGSGTTMVNSTVETTVRNSDVATHVRRTASNVSSFVRPAKLSTVQVPAIQEDVDNGLATAVGEWISPTDNVWRPGIQFQSASGLLSMNAALSTTPRRLAFTMEATETDNGVDDDGDGLIDEGTLEFTQDGNTIAMVREVELSEFEIDGRTISMRMRVARRDTKGRVYRAYVEQSLYTRNN